MRKPRLTKQHYSPKEVAEHFSVSKEMITGYLKRGYIKGIRVGRLWRIPRSELERLEKRGLEVKG